MSRRRRIPQKLRKIPHLSKFLSKPQRRAARKEKVVELHKQGLSGRQIATAIGSSEPTVRRDIASHDAANASDDAPSALGNAADAALEIPLESPAPREAPKNWVKRKPDYPR
jgi:IS30 family transposase